jgi:hypothetical protein
VRIIAVFPPGVRFSDPQDVDFFHASSFIMIIIIVIESEERQDAVIAYHPVIPKNDNYNFITNNKSWRTKSKSFLASWKMTKALNKYRPC